MEDVLFLACFLGIPVLMVLAIVWLIIRALRARFAFAGALREGWTEVPREVIDERLGEIPPLQLAGRVRVDRCARAEGPTRMVCRYRWSSRGVPETRQGRQEAWLIVPVDTPVPRAMIQARMGGRLEAIALAAGASFGAREVPVSAAWEWAIVHGDAEPDFFTDARAESLAAIVAPGQRLWFHDDVLVLALPEGAQTRLLEESAAIAQGLRDAI